MKKPLPAHVLHHDAVNQPIKIGDYIFMHGTSRGWDSRFVYGKVTELIARGYNGEQPGIKFLCCNAPRRKSSTVPPTYPPPDYTPKCDKASTIKLDAVVVIGKDIIPQAVLQCIEGVQQQQPTVSDSLRFIDEL